VTVAAPDFFDPWMIGRSFFKADKLAACCHCRPKFAYLGWPSQCTTSSVTPKCQLVCVWTVSEAAHRVCENLYQSTAPGISRDRWNHCNRVTGGETGHKALKTLAY